MGIKYSSWGNYPQLTRLEDTVVFGETALQRQVSKTAKCSLLNQNNWMAVIKCPETDLMTLVIHWKLRFADLMSS